MNLNPRFYTDTNNQVRLSVVRSAATAWHRPQGLTSTIRRFTIRQQVRWAYEAAQRELERFQDCPVAASIDRVDALIARHCVGGCDSLIREAAILAHAERRPAAISRRFNPSAMLAINALHAGEDLAAHIVEHAAFIHRDLHDYAENVFECIAPIDNSTAATVEDARWQILERVSRPKQFLEAAE